MLFIHKRISIAVHVSTLRLS